MVRSDDLNGIGDLAGAATAAGAGVILERAIPGSGGAVA